MHNVDDHQVNNDDDDDENDHDHDHDHDVDDQEQNEDDDDDDDHDKDLNGHEYDLDKTTFYEGVGNQDMVYVCTGNLFPYIEKVVTSSSFFSLLSSTGEMLEISSGKRALPEQEPEDLNESQKVGSTG